MYVTSSKDVEKGSGKYQSHGFGFRGRRSFVVTQDDVRAYLNTRGKGPDVDPEKDTEGDETLEAEMGR